MHQEKYSLTWHTYSDHLKSMMKELMMNEDFADVTLVTEDKKQIKANINILSTCSPVFKDILKKGNNSNQIMYLRGIQFTEIESILQFIYLGEATLFKERMQEFLAVAKLLEIEKLCNAETETNNEAEDAMCNAETETNNKAENAVCNAETETKNEAEDAHKQSPQVKRGIDGTNSNRKQPCPSTRFLATSSEPY